MSGNIKAQKFNLTVSLSEEPFGRKWKFVKQIVLPLHFGKTHEHRQLFSFEFFDDVTNGNVQKVHCYRN